MKCLEDVLQELRQKWAEMYAEVERGGTMYTQQQLIATAIQDLTTVYLMKDCRKPK